MTPQQKGCFDAIAAGIAANGHSPSYRELMVTLGVRSTGTICRLVDRLEERGLIRSRAGCARSIQIVVTPSIEGAAREVVRRWREGVLTNTALLALEEALGPERGQ